MARAFKGKIFSSPKKAREAYSKKARTRRITKKCLFCGEGFSVPKSWSKMKYCSKNCSNKAMVGRIPWNKGLKGIHLSPSTEFKDGNIAWWIEREEENPAKRSRVRKKKSKIAKKLWKEEKYVKKQIQAREVKPNKAETFFLNLMMKHGFPFDYVGDEKLIVGGKCPDYVSYDGQRKIIEMFGDYWHNQEEITERKRAFSEYGYETLIIWYSELKSDPEEVLTRVASFLEV